MNPMIGTRRTVTLAWQRYLPFSLADVQAYAPVQAGVYKIAVNLVNGQKRVVYVGQAADLDSRLKDHLSEWESNLDLYSLSSASTSAASPSPPCRFRPTVTPPSGRCA